MITAVLVTMKPDILLLYESNDEANPERIEATVENLPQSMILISHDPHFHHSTATSSLKPHGEGKNLHGARQNYPETAG